MAGQRKCDGGGAGGRAWDLVALRCRQQDLVAGGAPALQCDQWSARAIKAALARRAVGEGSAPSQGRGPGCWDGDEDACAGHGASVRGAAYDAASHSTAPSYCANSKPR